MLCESIEKTTKISLGIIKEIHLLISLIRTISRASASKKSKKKTIIICQLEKERDACAQMY